jgi:hypothetical protein
MPVTDVDIHELVRAKPWRRHLTHRGEQLDLGIYAAISTGQNPVATDGIWERMDLADFDPTVRSMIGQPFKLRAAQGPGKAGYIPDLMLISNDGKITLVDSSPTAGELCPSERVLDWAEEVISARGWTYEWWTGPKDAQHYTNIKALGGFCRPMHQVQQALIEPILALCADTELPIHAVEKSLTNEKMPQPMVRAVIQHLLWWGDLTTDLRRPITTGTRLRTDAAARRAPSSAARATSLSSTWTPPGSDKANAALTATISPRKPPPFPLPTSARFFRPSRSRCPADRRPGRMAPAGLRPEGEAPEQKERPAIPAPVRAQNYTCPTRRMGSGDGWSRDPVKHTFPADGQGTYAHPLAMGSHRRPAEGHSRA